MSLAFYASPIDESYEKITYNERKSYNQQSDKIKKKRKRKELGASNKVSVALENIHNNLNEEVDEDSLYNFNPPPIAESSGLERMDSENENNENMEYSVENFEVHQEEEYLEENDEPVYAEKYYTKELNNIPDYNFTQNMPSTDKYLEKKLDYVIKLLEQQKNEKTDHVTEELVLYTFLGIFIIYIADSFVKVGKYVR
jgi:hypothetical protein